MSLHGSKWHRLVEKKVTELERRGYRVRQPDGNHALLMHPDRSRRPFKISASRPAKDTLRYITKQLEGSDTRRSAGR